MSGAATGSPVAAPDNTITVTIGSQALAGWQDLRITRGIERCPSSAALSVTERFPNKPTETIVFPSAPVTVKAGADPLITGYCDNYNVAVAPETHQTSLVIRGLLSDLVDCSAVLPAFSLANATLKTLAEKLCAAFGIAVRAPDGDSAVIQQFTITLSETPFEILETIARWANFLLYEGTDGSLQIRRLGDTKMASGIEEGLNVQSASISFRMDERYTELTAVYQSTEVLIGAPPTDGSTGFVPIIAQAKDSGFRARADGKARYRPLIVVSEQTQNNPTLAQARAQWDMARRIGRSQVLSVTVDSWRDSSGALWAPNALVTIRLPSLKLPSATWLISEVTFVRNDRQGTVAELTLMPPQAFVPMPTNLLPFEWDVYNDASGQPSNGAASTFTPR